MRDDEDPGARFETIEIKLAELELGQGQIDDVVRRQGEDIRRLTEAVRQLGTRLEAALGESAPSATPGAASAEADPERPPHYSGPAR